MTSTQRWVLAALVATGCSTGTARVAATSTAVAPTTRRSHDHRCAARCADNLGRADHVGRADNRCADDGCADNDHNGDT